MNQGVVHGSQMVATGNTNWWSVTNTSTPPRHQHRSFLAVPSHDYFPHQLNDNQEFPDPWSQLLLESEQVEEEDNKSSTGMEKMHANNMEKYYEEQLMNQMISNNSYFADLKQDQNMEWKIVKRRDYSDPSSECYSTARGGANKKARIQPTSSQTTFKVRKETLRDKITAVHQLVSPFGKTDTASVLLEAVGYIRFLQNQIEALTKPYLGSESRNTRNQLSESDKKEANKELRRRGLCLVPVSCTFNLASDNAADYWASSPFAANLR